MAGDTLAPMRRFVETLVGLSIGSLAAACSSASDGAASNAMSNGLAGATSAGGAGGGAGGAASAGKGGASNGGAAGWAAGAGKAGGGGVAKGGGGSGGGSGKGGGGKGGSSGSSGSSTGGSSGGSSGSTGGGSSGSSAGGGSGGGKGGSSGSTGGGGKGGSSGSTGGGSSTGGSSSTGGGGGPVVFGDPFFAISPDEGSWGPAQAALLRSLGAGMVRFQMCDWPASAAALDAKVDAARAAGLHVYAELNYCTLSAKYPDTVSWHAGYTDGGNPFTWDFAGAAGQIAAHFAGRVGHYEIWNEPDGAPRPIGWDGSGPIQYADPASADWAGACGSNQLDGTPGYAYGTPYVPLAQSWALCPRQLGTLTTNAYMAIKGGDPSAKVVAGNLLFHGTDGWVAKEYWKQVEASGAVNWYKTTKTNGQLPWDVIGTHPYGYRPDDGSLAGQLQAFQTIVSSFGDPAPLAISEYGWHTDPNGGDPNYRVDEPTQAAFVTQTFGVAKQHGLSFVMWFNYLDAPNDALDFGLRKVTGSGQPSGWKPSAKAYCQAASASACPAP